MPYAYICSNCNHPFNRHLLVEGGDFKNGPYGCEHCDCNVAQDQRCYTLNQKQFEAKYDSRGALRFRNEQEG